MSSRGTWPQMASTGAPDFLASYRPLSRWMEPGPTVPMQTPRRPVSWACAPAANAPTSSCRTPTQSIRSSRRMASVTGLSASPTTPHTWVTPCSASDSINSSATVVMAARTHHPGMDPGSTATGWVGQDAAHDDLPRPVREDRTSAGVAVPAAQPACLHRAQVRVAGRRGGDAERRLHARFRVRAHLRGRVAALREGRVGQGAAALRRVLPRGGAQADGAARVGRGAAAAVDARRRLGGAGPGVRRRAQPRPPVAPGRPRRLSRRLRDDRRRADTSARRTRPGPDRGRVRRPGRRPGSTSARRSRTSRTSTTPPRWPPVSPTSARARRSCTPTCATTTS